MYICTHSITGVSHICIVDFTWYVCMYVCLYVCMVSHRTPTYTSILKISIKISKDLGMSEKA